MAYAPNITDTVDSCCGLHCTGCGWKKSNGCGGCIETGGAPVPRRLPGRGVLPGQGLCPLWRMPGTALPAAHGLFL